MDMLAGGTYHPDAEGKDRLSMTPGSRQRAASQGGKDNSPVIGVIMDSFGGNYSIS